MGSTAACGTKQVWTPPSLNLSSHVDFLLSESSCHRLLACAAPLTVTEITAVYLRGAQDTSWMGLQVTVNVSVEQSNGRMTVGSWYSFIPFFTSVHQVIDDHVWTSASFMDCLTCTVHTLPSLISLLQQQRAVLVLQTFCNVTVRPTRCHLRGVDSNQKIWIKRLFNNPRGKRIFKFNFLKENCFFKN